MEPSLARPIAISLYSLVLAFAAGRQPDYSGPFHIERKPHKSVLISALTSYSFPNNEVAEWMIYAPLPPKLEGQSEITAKVMFKDTRFEELFSEPSENRKLLCLRVPVKDQPKELAKSITIESVYQAMLYSRRLVPGPPSEPVPHLSAEERNLNLKATPNANYRDAAIRKWIADNDLFRMPGDTDLSFALRVLEKMRATLSYGGSRDDNSATNTVKKGQAVCTGLASLYVAVLRANDIPARTLCGWNTKRQHITDPSELDLNACHRTAEFFSEGIGWVPVEVSDAMSYPNRPLEDYFGVDPGTFFVMHTGIDLEIKKVSGSKYNAEEVTGVIFMARLQTPSEATPIYTEARRAITLKLFDTEGGR